MIINTQAFNTMKEGAKNKAARIINSERDEFGSRKPIAVLAAQQPYHHSGWTAEDGVLLHRRHSKPLNPLFTPELLSYPQGAPTTRCMCFDALDAYNHKLVKKIEVVGFELKEPEGTDSYIYFCRAATLERQGSTGKTEIEQQSTTGAIKRIYKKLGRRRWPL